MMAEEDGQAWQGPDDQNYLRAPGMGWMSRSGHGPDIGQMPMERSRSNGLRGRPRERDQQDSQARGVSGRWDEIPSRKQRNSSQNRSPSPPLPPLGDIPEATRPRYQRSSPLPLDRKAGAAQVTNIPESADIKHLLGAVSNAIGANRVNNKVWIANGTAILQFESVTYLDLLLKGKGKIKGEMEIKVGGKASTLDIVRVDLDTVRVKFEPRSMGLGWCQTPQKKAGCVVVDVTPNSQAAKLGVKRGWIATQVEDNDLDSRGPIGIIEKHKKKDRPFHVTFQHIVQREVRRTRSNSLGSPVAGGSRAPLKTRSAPIDEYTRLRLSPSAMSFEPFNVTIPNSERPTRTVSGKLQDDNIMYSPKSSRQTSESGGFHPPPPQMMTLGQPRMAYRDHTGYSDQRQMPMGQRRDGYQEYYDGYDRSDMSWANAVRGGSQTGHNNMVQQVSHRLQQSRRAPPPGMGAPRGRGSRVPMTSGTSVRLAHPGPRGQPYGEKRVVLTQTSDSSASGPKRKRRSGRRGKKNMDPRYADSHMYGSRDSFDDRYDRPLPRPSRTYTCPQCATKCNGPQQLQQHIGSAGCKLRQLNLSRVECQPERSVFIGNIPLNCTEKDVLKSLQDRGIQVDKLPAINDGQEPIYVIEMRMGKKCKYAVVQLISADERLKVVTIHHDETITDKVMISGDIIQFAEDGKTPLKNDDDSMVTKYGTVQLDIKPCRPRGEKRQSAH